MKNHPQNWCKKLVLTGVVAAMALAGGIVSEPLSAHAAATTTTSYSASQATRIINTGIRYLGTPYQYGAPSGQTNTFDCSSFVQYVYKKNGISLPRSSREQAKVGRYVPRSQLRAGDLVFFSIPGSPGLIHHVAIYAGNNQILHTYGAGGVRFTSLSSGTWSQRYITASRVL